MARSRLKAAVVVLGLAFGALGAPYAAQAAMAVIDGTAIGKLVEQINEMKKQYAAQLQQLAALKESLSFLNEINKLSTEISNAIGKIGRISLPLPNLDKIAAQTKSNLRCLMPDGASLKWGIKTEDINLGSICDTSSRYRSALFADPEQMSGMTFAQREARRAEVISNREALLEDTVTRSLALADVQLKQAEELNKTADDLQSALDRAETTQDREHVQGQIAVAKLRSQAQQTQMMAQLLRLHGAMAAMAGMPADKVQELTKGAR